MRGIQVVDTADASTLQSGIREWRMADAVREVGGLVFLGFYDVLGSGVLYMCAVLYHNDDTYGRIFARGALGFSLSGWQINSNLVNNQYT